MQLLVSSSTSVVCVVTQKACMHCLCGATTAGAQHECSQFATRQVMSKERAG